MRIPCGACRLGRKCRNSRQDELAVKRQHAFSRRAAPMQKHDCRLGLLRRWASPEEGLKGVRINAIALSCCRSYGAALSRAPNDGDLSQR